VVPGARGDRLTMAFAAGWLRGPRPPAALTRSAMTKRVPTIPGAGLPYRAPALAGLALLLSLGAAACADTAPAGDVAAQPAPGDTLAPGEAGEAAPGANGAPRALRIGSSAAEAAACQQRIDQRLVSRVDSLRADTTAKPSFRRGEDPITAVESGWPPQKPAPLDESILPCHRIVVYYGNPLQTRMGILGEYPKDEMLQRLRRQVAEWEQADPETPVIPGLHMVAIVAQGDAGTSGHYRTIMRDSLIEETHRWAQEVGGIFFVDIQVGTDNIRNLLPRMEKFLIRPDVHLGIDPEFMMKDGSVPGRRIGTMDAADINYASEYLANLVREHNLPPKVFIVHRFTQNMVTNTRNIQLRPEVQLVMHMDGWGRPFLKRDTYHRHIVREPVQFPGFKIFYHHDSREDPLMRPADVLRLWPKPLYIQYQ
jgi:hypothetical protein